MNFKKRIVKSKYYLDIGMSVFPIVNFVLLIIAASDNLRNMFPFHIGTDVLILALTPTTLVGVFCLGYMLDKHLNYRKILQEEDWQRNKLFMDMKSDLEDIKKSVAVAN